MAWIKKKNAESDGSDPQPVAGPKVLSPMDAPTAPAAQESLMTSGYRCVVGEDVAFQGKLSFDFPVKIDGVLKGEIFTSAALIIGPKARVSAKVSATVLIVQGDVSGSIVTSEGVEICSGGVLAGSVITPKLKLEEGAVLNASCSMTPQSCLRFN